MGIDCSKCDLGTNEKQNEISRQSLGPSITYGTKDNNRGFNLLKNKRNSTDYYRENEAKIIFLQIKIKKYLNQLKEKSKEAFYINNYNNGELSKSNISPITEKTERNNIDNNNVLRTKKEDNYQPLNRKSDKYKSLSQNYNTLSNKSNNSNNNNNNNNNNNMVFIENKPYKVENYQINDLAKYTGEMVNGLQHGYGIQQWEDGAKYEGDWKNGKTFGYGIFYHPDGDIYKGYWKDDKANGKGIYTTSDGVKYNGDWVNDCQEGFGIETWNDGSVYKGSYKEGKKQGYGEYVWADGSKYEGNWDNNNQDGFGVYSWPDNKIYEGYFQNNILQGEGHYSWPDGRDYIGSFKQGKKDGLGRYLWPDGRSYIGFWENGKQYGLGQYTNENKVEMLGIWLNGKRNRWLTDEEIKALKEENDNFLVQILSFDPERYNFNSEKENIKICKANNKSNNSDTEY